MARTLHNQPGPTIADEYGSLSELKKDLEKRMKILREEILAREVDVLPGHEYTITIARAQRATLDKDKVIVELGQEWWNARTKTSDVETITARKQVKSEAA